MQIPHELVHIILFSAASLGTGGCGIVQLEPPGCHQLLVVATAPPKAAGGFGSTRGLE